MKRFLIAAAVLVVTAATATAQDIPLSKILVEGEGWKVAAKDLSGVSFLVGGPPGVLVVEKQLVRLWSDGELKEIKLPASVQDWLFKDRTKGRTGATYTAQSDRKVIFVVRSTEATLVRTEPNAFSCLCMWPDESQLVLGDPRGEYLWTFRVQKDGTLGSGDRYYALRVKPGEKASGVTAMAMDGGNLLYACTPLGVQVFDPTGRLCGVVLPPSKEEMTAITIGGEKGDTLFVAAGDKIYSRKIQGKAAYTLKKDK
jgi:enterochelin esterase family protein